MKFTSVVGFHMNPLSCGVAKFSSELAQRLKVPFVSLEEPNDWGHYPLLSLKWSEIPDPERFWVYVTGHYGLFWHDAGNAALSSSADVVMYADASLGSPALWCPSLLQPKPRVIRLFSFGMASKLQVHRFAQAQQLLENAGLRYHLRVSVGLHEGTTIDAAEEQFALLRSILGPEHVTVLGSLSDDAVAEELANTDYVLAFFEKGVRANNTTVHAALDAGCRVITNHDQRTPAPMRMSTMDIAALTTWPAFNKTPMAAYSWDNLITEMEKLCAASPSALAK